jgi:integrase
VVHGLVRRSPRNTFLYTRVWLPAVSNAGLGFHVRMHELRHAHTSWLLAGDADLKSVMEPMGHSQITTTQSYLHTLPDADDQAIEIFDGAARSRRAAPRNLRREASHSTSASQDYEYV